MKRAILIFLAISGICLDTFAQFGEQITCGGEFNNPYNFLLSADLNNDGSEELIGLKSDRVSILQHNSPLTFNEPIELFYDFGTITTANAADVDADGLIDLILSRMLNFDSANVSITGKIVPPGPPLFYGLGEIFILRNTGNLTFSPPLRVSKNMGLINYLEVLNLNDTPELEIIASGRNVSLGIVNGYLPRTSIFHTHSYLDTVPSQEKLLLIDTIYPSKVSSFALGDWDGDGDKDILLNNEADSLLIIWDNLQMLNFAITDSISTTSLNVVQVKTAQINHDAFDDLIISGILNNYYVHAASILNNNGSLHNAPSIIDSIPSFGYENKIYFELMDVNWDGYTDIVLPYPWLAAFINQQNGTYSSEPEYLQRDMIQFIENYIPHAIENNIKNDLVITTNNSAHTYSIGIFQNPYGNTEEFDIVYPSCVGYPLTLKAEDLTGDGQTDLIIYSENYECLFMLSEHENSQFNRRTFLNPIAGWGDFQTADFDHDGDLDLAIETGYYGKIHVAFNNGFGAFTDTMVYEGFSQGQYDLTTADINQDGFSDIVVSRYYVAWGMNEQGALLGVLLNNGDGTFQPMVSTSYMLKVGGELLPIDWDDDGFVDLISRNDSGLVWIKNEAGANWATAKVIVQPQLYTFPIRSDLNQDGIYDLAYIDYGNHRNLVGILNLADTNFVTTVLIDSVHGGAPFLMPDLNWDGIPDLITCDYSNVTIKYCLMENGNTQPNFQVISDTSRASSLTMGDLNNDGFQDLICVDPYTNSTFWFYQDPGSPTLFNKQNLKESVHVSPNPNHGNFRIEGLQNQTLKNVTLFTADGKIAEKFGLNGSSTFQVSKKYVPGFYILQGETEQGLFHIKLIIE